MSDPHAASRRQRQAATGGQPRGKQKGALRIHVTLMRDEENTSAARRSDSQEHGIPKRRTEQGVLKTHAFRLAKTPSRPSSQTGFCPHCLSSRPSLVLPPTGRLCHPTGFSQQSPLTEAGTGASPLSARTLCWDWGPGCSFQLLISTCEAEQGTRGLPPGVHWLCFLVPPRTLSWGSTHGPAGRGAESRMVMT